MRTIGYSAVDLMFAGLLVMMLNGWPKALVSLCRWRALVWIGTVSYGLYLLHVPAGVIARRFTPHVGDLPVWLGRLGRMHCGRDAGRLDFMDHF